MKRLLLSALLVTSFASVATAETNQGHATKEETWTGKIEKKDATNVEFVAGDKKFEITGNIETELLKEVGKEVKLTGTMSTDHKSIQAVKAEPVTMAK